MIASDRRCDQCYFVERVPPGTHPLVCRREHPSVRCSDLRAPGGLCEGGKNFLLNRRAVRKAEVDEPLD